MDAFGKGVLFHLFLLFFFLSLRLIYVKCEKRLKFWLFSEVKTHFSCLLYALHICKELEFFDSCKPGETVWVCVCTILGLLGIDLLHHSVCFAVVVFFFCFFRIINVLRCTFIFFGLGLLFFFVCVCVMLLNSCSIFRPYTNFYMNGFAEVHTLFYCVRSTYSSQKKSRAQKKDVIALGHSTFELASHSTFIDLHTNADSQPFSAKGHTWVRFIPPPK